MHLPLNRKSARLHAKRATKRSLNLQSLVLTRKLFAAQYSKRASKSFAKSWNDLLVARVEERGTQGSSCLSAREHSHKPKSNQPWKRG